MLDSLDTLIAFALIFAVVSMLITIVVQMISSVLNLRGINLAWGIAEAFEAIDPGLGQKTRTAAVGKWQQLREWLSTRLPRWFPQISQAKELANHCLNDFLLSDAQILGFRGMASAVRPDELFDLLHRIAIGKQPTTQGEIRRQAITLFKALGVPESVFALTPQQTASLTALKESLAAEKLKIPADTEAYKVMDDKLNETKATLSQSAATAEQAADRWAAQGEAQIQKVYQQYNQWFSTAEGRSTEWFKTHTRIVTGLLGLVFAIFLQLDTIEIYKIVSTNRDVRSSLVAQVKSFTDQAQRVLGDNPEMLRTAVGNLPSDIKSKVTVKAESTVEDVEKQAEDSYKKNLSDSLDVALKDLKDPLDATAANAALDQWEKSIKDEGLLKNLHARAAAAGGKKEEWINGVKRDLAVAIPASSALAQITQVAKDQLASGITNYKVMKGELDHTGFDLFPPSFMGRWDLSHWEVCHPIHLFGIWCGHRYSHILGMLFSALLLSLGAPFWFNALKSLASLRSSVAENISDTEEAAEKKGDSAKPTPPPSVR